MLTIVGFQEVERTTSEKYQNWLKKISKTAKTVC